MLLCLGVGSLGNRLLLSPDVTTALDWNIPRLTARDFLPSRKPEWLQHSLYKSKIYAPGYIGVKATQLGSANALCVASGRASLIGFAQREEESGKMERHGYKSRTANRRINQSLVLRLKARRNSPHTVACLEDGRCDESLTSQPA